VDDGLVVELQMLVARRRDLVADRVGTINRLREQLLGIFPALERRLDMTKKGSLRLLTKSTSGRLKICEAGADQIRSWLLSQKARRTATQAGRVVAAARRTASRYPRPPSWTWLRHMAESRSRRRGPVPDAVGLMAQGEDGRLDTVLQIELGKDTADVGLDGLFTDR
jgi:hypothetical protein